MLKKVVLLSVVILSALALPAWALRQGEITMLIVPAEKMPVQIAQDISRRYPVLIVSYELVKGQWNIYAWNDETWVPVSTEDYANGIFFANRPKYAIVVEHERFHAPAFLTPNSTWCENASRLASTDPRVMIHLFGLHFDFPYRHWNQFAKRYNYQLEEINPTLENVHWWNLRGDMLIKKHAKRDFSIDLNRWHYLETLPPPPVEPVLIEESRKIPEVEVPASEPVKGIKVNAPPPAATAPAPVKEKDSAVLKDTAVNAPAIKPAPAPAPAVKPAPVARPIPSIEPVPATKPAPAAAPLPVPPSVEPAPPAELSPAPLIETVPAAEVKSTIETSAPAAEPTVEADPFATGSEIPAAEIVVPQEPKKSKWKLF